VREPFSYPFHICRTPTHSELYTRTAIGKRITPDEYTRSFPGNHHYCFVDFENKADLDATTKALNGTIYLGSRLKVRPAREMPKTLKDARLGLRNNRPDENEDQISYFDYMARSSRAFQSNDWRRRDK
jgi:hypothetical protein